MSKRICKHPGCDRPHRAKGWCTMHYFRARRDADMDAPAQVQNHGWHPFDRVMARVEWVGKCLEYTGHRNLYGYGDLGRAGAAHVVVWEYHNGPVPAGMVVRHYVCDNPPCVNIEHLRIGTQADNIADAVAKGRHHHGEAHRSAKLTEEQVRYIRSSSERGVDLAVMFGVSPSQISTVRAGRSWRHLL